MMQATFDIAHQLSAEGGGASDDEGGEEEDCGLRAMDPVQMHPSGVPQVGRLPFEEECVQRAARRASSNNAASFAMTEQSLPASDRAAARFLRFLMLAYGVVGNEEEPLEDQAIHIASFVNAALSFRISRFFSLLREGGWALLVSGKGTPISIATISNMASSLGHFYAKGSRDFAGQTPHVVGCCQRTDVFKAVPHSVLSAAQVAAGETHRDNMLIHEAVAGWVSGAVLPGRGAGAQ